MKGIIIYENDLRAINAVKLKNASFCYESVEDDKTDILQGRPVTCTSTTCNKEDTYDFETGALIALMKMCGSDKVVRACNEAFSYETDIKVLRKDNNNLREANKGLQEEVKRLKGESESHWKKYQRNIQKKQDRINELNNIEEEYIKLREEYDSLFEENEKLQHEYNLCKNSENALKCSVEYLNKSIAKLNTAIYGYKNDLYNVFTRKCVEEWLYGPLTKREEMWGKIRDFTFNGASCVEVNKADVIDFLEDLEKEMPNIHWSTGERPTATKPMFNFKPCYEYDKVYFFIDYVHITFAFGKETSRENVQYVTYLPPMRWDLFKKGRLVVKVDTDNYEDFYNTCEIEIGRKPLKACEGIFTVYYKRGTFHTRPYDEKIPYKHKVVNWEDVR